MSWKLIVGGGSLRFYLKIHSWEEEDSENGLSSYSGSLPKVTQVSVILSICSEQAEAPGSWDPAKQLIQSLGPDTL